MTTVTTTGNIVLSGTGLPVSDRLAIVKIAGNKWELLDNSTWLELKAAVTTVTEPPVVVIPPVVVVPPVVVTPPVGTAITPAGFAAALSAAKGGEVLQLSNSIYVMPRSPKFVNPVTIKGGIFATIDMNAAEGLIFEGSTFEYKFKSGEQLEHSPFYFFGSKRIVLNNCKVTGSGDTAGYGSGRGLTFDTCDTIVISGGSITKFLRAVYADATKNLTIKGVNISGIRSDGLQVHGGSFLKIENNYIHDFRTPPNASDHADMIQLFAVGSTKPTSDVLIKGNTLDIGQGSQTQSMLLSSQNGLAFERMVVENNTIINAHLHGISVGPAKVLTIRNNAVIAGVPNPADGENAVYLKTWGAQHGIMVPIIDVTSDSTGVTVQNNAFAGATWYGGKRYTPVAGHTNSNNVVYSTVAAIPTTIGAPTRI